MSKNIIIDLLEKLNPTLDTMVDNIFKVENYKREKDGSKTKIYSEYDRKLEKLSIMHDIVKSFSTYTKLTDVLVEFSVKGSRKGTLQIEAKISRDGDSKYFLETRLIYAGGYNVQRLHYRVITSSNLPKDGDKTMMNGLALQIKKMTTTERLEKEIKSIESAIKRYTTELLEVEGLTDEKILESRYDSSRSLKSYETLQPDYEYWENGFVVFTYANNTEDEYNKLIEKENITYVKNFKRINISIRKADIKKMQKSIEKIKTKISEL